MCRAPRISLSVLATIFSLCLARETVFAGPPLLCHPIEIGKAESLPWGSAAWDNKKIKFSDVDFVKHTLALLAPETPTLVRMETIRRATIHVAEHPDAAGTLLATVRGRTTRTDSLSMSHASSLFDLGYLLACYSQMNVVTANESKGYDGGPRTPLAVLNDLSSINLLTKASALTPGDAAIEFALALVTWFPEDSSHKEHVQKAVAGASEGSLLASNLIKHFGQKGQTLADLRTSFGMNGDAERR